MKDGCIPYKIGKIIRLFVFSGFGRISINIGAVIGDVSEKDINCVPYPPISDKKV